MEKESNTRLQKVNTTLQKHLNDYTLAFTAEKKEKKELMEKYDTLQNKYHEKIEKFAKRYYLALGICLVLAFGLLLQLTPNLFK